MAKESFPNLDNKIIENTSITTDKSGYIETNNNYETSIKNIFAIGDICTYDGKASLIINGFGEGPVAINSAYKKIFPDAIIGALHSSSSIGGK